MNDTIHGREQPKEQSTKGVNQYEVGGWGCHLWTGGGLDETALHSTLPPPLLQKKKKKYFKKSTRTNRILPYIYLTKLFYRTTRPKHVKLQNDYLYTKLLLQTQSQKHSFLTALAPRASGRCCPRLRRAASRWFGSRRPPSRGRRSCRTGCGARRR